MLAPVPAPLAAVTEERRRAPRVEVLGQLHGSIVALRMSVVVRDIGPGGFSIETPLPFPKHSAQQFRFSTPDGEKDVLLNGQSVHCLRVSPGNDRPRYLTGFSFVLDDDQSRREVEALLAKLAPS